MLPKKQNKVIPVQLSKDKIVKVSLWKSKQQRDYLIFLSTLDENSDYDKISEDVFNILLKDNVQDYDKLELTDNEKYYLLIKLRELSISDTIELSFVCSNEDCKFTNEIEVPIKDIVKYKPISLKNVRVNGTLYFMKLDYKLFKEKTNKADMTDEERDFILICSSIDKIQTPDNKEYIKGKDYDFDEIYEWISELPVKEFEELARKFSSMWESLEFVIKAKCIKCGKEHIEEVDSIPNLLWE